MSLRENLDVLTRVAEVATLAGIKGHIDEDAMHFQAGFSLNGNRSQTVYIRPTGKTPAGKSVVTIFSPCLIVESGFLKGLSKAKVIELLTQNENILFARFGLVTTPSGQMIVASVDHLLDTLDPEELHDSMWFVAFAADSEEEKLKQDNF